MFSRLLQTELQRASSQLPVIVVVGPRQSGKTTLARETFGRTHRYVSLERPDTRREAIEDPVGFLSNLSEGAIIDEVQRAPELLSYLQVMVDEDSRPGRFVLTGSQNLLLMDSVSQTLAGRSAIHHLLPLALHELLDRSAPDPEHLDDFAQPPAPPGLELWDVVWRGLYPRIHDMHLDPTRWLGGYFRTYVERDLRDVLRVMNLDAFERFVRLVAGRTGQELNYAAIASDAGITLPTAKQWLTALRVGFIVTLLPSHHQNFRKRVRKRPKLHFLDTGLACYLLGIRDPQTLSQHPLRGPIFESFVASELTKCFVHRGLEAPLFHWRDATGHEIDLLIDLGSRQIPIEVKAGKTVASDALDTLRWWSELPANPNTGGVLVYGGEEGRMRSGIAIRPWYLE